jgi:dTMP kinase
MNARPGILIVFDGIDGAGKTTQVDLLAQALVAAGEQVIVSKEPTDGQWGMKLRASATAGRMPAEEELQTFLLDRQEHLSTKVRPALDAGKVVILDRYFYSTIAYQGLRLPDIEALEPRVREGTEAPDLAIFLDIPAELAAMRIKSRDGRANDFEKTEDLEKIGRLFSVIAGHDSAVTTLDGTLSRKALHQSIVELLVDGALKAKRCAKAYGCDDPLHCTPRLTNNCAWWRSAKALRSQAGGAI